MQFQVPQFIETEDKIVGPLSLRQFMYIGAGVGISAMLYFVLQMWLWLILSVIFVGGAIGIAFVKIQGRPLAKVIEAALHYYWNPQTYIWKAATATPLPKHHAAVAREAVTPLVPLRKKVAGGTALHKHWEGLQTGEKMSSHEFEERKTNARYQILERRAGDRMAARRVDYR